MATLPIILSTGSTSGAGVAGEGRNDLVIGETVTLTDTVVENAAANYLWEFDDAPIGSAAVLVDEDTATPTFVPDVTGSYRIKCTVNGVFINYDIIAVPLENTGARIPSFRERTQYDGDGNTVGWHEAMTGFMRTTDAALAGGGGGSGFVFQPGGGGTGPTVFADWEELHTALEQAKVDAGGTPPTGAWYVYFDAPTCTIPAGEWDMSNVVMSGLPSVGGLAATAVEIADGATLPGLRRIEGAISVVSVSTAPVVVITEDFQFIEIKNGCQVYGDTDPFFTFDGGGGAGITIKITDASWSPIAIEMLDADTCKVYMYDNATVEEDAIIGATADVEVTLFNNNYYEFGAQNNVNSVTISGEDGGMVRVSASDEQLARLDQKIVAGDGISIDVLDPGGDEQLEISATSAVGAPNSGMVLHTDETFDGTLGTLTAVSLAAGTPSHITAVGAAAGVYSLSQRDSGVTFQPEPATYSGFGKAYTMATNFVAWASMGGCFENGLNAGLVQLALSTATGGVPTGNDYLIIRAFAVGAGAVGIEWATRVNGVSAGATSGVFSSPWPGGIMGIIKEGTKYRGFAGHPGGAMTKFATLSAPAWGTAPNNIGIHGYSSSGDTVYCAKRFCIYEGTGFLPF